MKKSYAKYISLLTFVLIAVVVVILFVREDSQKQVGTYFYEQWTKRYVQTLHDGKQAYINTQPQKSEGVSLSEGHGYGMYICVLASQQGKDTKKVFDQLNAYYKAHCYHDTALMSWRQTIKDGTVTQEKNNATDGDLYIAYALLEASKEWHEPSYKKEALAILRDILTYNYNKTLHTLTVGNWATKETKYYAMIRTSDCLPKLFDTFYEATNDENWQWIHQNMMMYLKQLSDQQKTGLLPDFALINNGEAKPVKSKFVSSKYDGDYYYNACRVPYNLADDNHQNSRAILYKLLDFFMTQNKIKAGYYLDGKPIDRHTSGIFGAPLLYAALCHKKQYDKLFLQEKQLLMHSLNQADYYESVLITLIALQVNSIS